MLVVFRIKKIEEAGVDSLDPGIDTELAGRECWICNNECWEGSSGHLPLPQNESFSVSIFFKFKKYFSAFC